MLYQVELSCTNVLGWFSAVLYCAVLIVLSCTEFIEPCVVNYADLVVLGYYIVELGLVGL